MKSKLIFAILSIVFIAVMAVGYVYYTKPINRLHRRAEQGAPGAQFQLAICYLSGNEIIQDNKHAIYWMRKSANQGYEKAQDFWGCWINVSDVNV